MCAGYDGSNVEQREYNGTNDSYKDEWVIKHLKDSAFIALPATYDRSSFFATAIGYLESIGYTDNFDNHNTISDGMSKKDFLDHMQLSKITVVRTHGLKTEISLTGERLTRADLLALPSNALGYSELVVYGACLTANGGSLDNNLVAATVSAGARTVIGFEDSVDSRGCNPWCEKFFEYYSLYYNDESKNFYDVCHKTDEDMQGHEFYTVGYPDGSIATLANYVIAGEWDFP